MLFIFVIVQNVCVMDLQSVISNLSNFEIFFFIEVYFSVSLWEYVSYQIKTEKINYTGSYGYLSLLQWLTILVGLTFVLGYRIGIITFILILLFLQYLCHFTLGLVINQLIGKNKNLPFQLFSINICFLIAIVGVFLIINGI